MYRRINGKVYGVLTDFDLSSWTVALAGDYTKTSQKRTGTPPFMAHGLLAGTDPLHLYRHDVESLFYMMLIVATRYEIEPPRTGKRRKGGMRTRKGLVELPFHDWFDPPSYKALADSKQIFLLDMPHIDLSPAFEDFGDWLEDIRTAFYDGLLAKKSHRGSVLLAHRKTRSGGRAIRSFDDATLGGHICYYTLTGSARNLQGKLEGLIVRYDS